jgi:hypothetical protein
VAIFLVPFVDRFDALFQFGVLIAIEPLFAPIQSNQPVN